LLRLQRARGPLPRGQRGKGRAKPLGERAELRFSAPSHPNRARERILRALPCRSGFPCAFGSASAKTAPERLEER
jgi:hypothetical protein